MPRNARTPIPAHHSRTGLLYALSAYAIWGLFPLYFRAVAQVPPLVVLCYRIVWSAVFISLVVSVRRDWKPIWQVAQSRRNLLLLSVGAVLIALNWLIFIYAVGSRQTLQASLGYFINPLVSIALGMIFLRERLRGWQWCAVLIALSAVISLVLRGAGFPWLAVSLACSFAFYGLVRKTVNVNSLHGLLVESVLLLPVAVGTLALLPRHQTSLSEPMFGLLSLSGILTAIPLLLFGAALRRLPLSAIGFLQYIGPTLQLLVALFVFHEPLDAARLTSFVLCWLALAVYSADTILHRRSQVVADEPD